MLSKILGGTPIHRKEKTKMRIETEEYMTIQRREEVRAEARKLRKQFLRYKEAEIVYSMQHKKLLELADRAGALYRIDGYVLINREIFADKEEVDYSDKEKKFSKTEVAKKPWKWQKK